MLLFQDEGDDGVDVGDGDFVVAVDVTAGISCATAEDDRDDGIDIGDADFAVTVDIALHGLSGTAIDETDDWALSRGVADAVKVQVTGLATGIVGRAVFHEFAVNLDLLGGQCSLILAVFQRLDEA